LGIQFLPFAGTQFTRYLNMIEVRVTLSADNGPKEIKPLQSGRLIRLFVQKGEQAKQSDMLGWLENITNPDERFKKLAYP